MISDVPIGAFLSGGIDSSAVVALMREVNPGRISTFNIAFREKEYDESAYAEIVAKKFQTDHHTITVDAEKFLSDLIPALDAMDSPSADGINTYVVSKAIRKAGITVALSGIGGDELFAGYPFFKQYTFLNRVNKFGIPGRLVKKVGSLLAGLSGSPASSKARALLAADGSDITSLYPEFRRIISASTIKTIFSGHWNGKTNFERWLVDRRYSLAGLPLLSQVSAAEYLGYTQHTLLKDTDQMSMAVSLEVREPFFDHELIEYILGVPDSLKRPAYPKQLLVESLDPLLPKEIVFRKKKGFLFPWSVWMKTELESFCQEKIDNICSRDFVNPDAVRFYWKLFVSGSPKVRWTELWILIVLEHWMEKNNIT
jgi:asparagine synthase (glutamine-hydrolysing)